MSIKALLRRSSVGCAMCFLVIAALNPSSALPSDKNALSLEGATQTLAENFSSQPVWRPGGTQTDVGARPFTDASFSWAAGYIWNHAPRGAAKVWPLPKDYFPAWTSNTTANADPNGDMIKKMGNELSPLTWSGTLDFSVKKMPAELARTVGPEDPTGYMGSSISSFPYSQQYGIFSITAKIPKGKGVWPAFWLIPADKTWPPEIDIFEVLGEDTTVLYTNLHTNIPRKKTAIHNKVDAGIDLSADFHEYAVDWGPEYICWYLDRKLIHKYPTPQDMHKPFYIIANVSVGKPEGWGGAPDESTKLPATMKVSSIRVWQRPAYAQVISNLYHHNTGSHKAR